MNTRTLIATFFFLTAISACNRNERKFDASGVFETDEVIVSSELPGKILSFSVEEGQTISKDSIVGVIDSENITLQKEQVEASIKALSEKTNDVQPQVKLLEQELAVKQSQLNTQLREKARIKPDQNGCSHWQTTG